MKDVEPGLIGVSIEMCKGVDSDETCKLVAKRHTGLAPGAAVAGTANGTNEEVGELNEVILARFDCFDEDD